MSPVARSPRKGGQRSGAGPTTPATLALDALGIAYTGHTYAVSYTHLTLPTN